jgi:transcriptional regulator with XRE-family HTH domain
MSNTSLPKTRLGKARRIAEITQVELARAVGASLDWLRHIEAGDNPLSGSFAGKFGAYLGVDSHWLMGAGDEAKPPAIAGGVFDKEAYKKWRNIPMQPHIRAGELRDFIKELIDESFSDERYKEDWMRTWLAMPGYPDAQAFAIIERIKDVIQWNPPGKVWSMAFDDWKKARKAIKEPAPSKRRKS